jgi:hypothetical protein
LTCSQSVVVEPVEAVAVVTLQLVVAVAVR